MEMPPEMPPETPPALALMAPEGVTAVSGRVLRLDGRPLPDVTLEIDGHETTTDRTGRFLLQLDSWISRLATLDVDAPRRTRRLGPTGSTKRCAVDEELQTRK